MDRILRRADGLSVLLLALLVCPLLGSETEPGKHVNCGTADRPLYRSGSGPSLGAEPYAQYIDLTAEGAEKPCAWSYGERGFHERARTLWSSYAAAFETKDWDNTAPGSHYRRVVLDWGGRRIVLKSSHPFIKRAPEEDPITRRKRKAFDAIVSALNIAQGPPITIGGPKKAEVKNLAKMTLEQLRKTADAPGDARTHQAAMERIIGKRKQARPYLPWLAVRLSSASSNAFSEALFLIGPPGEEERPALARLLRHENAFVRERASRALAAMGGAGGRSYGELQSAIRRTAGSERMLHARSLAAVTAGSPKTAVFLREVLRVSSPAERYELVELLLRFDGTENAARELFKAARGYERMQLAAHLLTFNARHEDVREFFESSRGADRTAVARLLFNSGTQDEDVLEVLLEGVKRADPDAIRYILTSQAAPRAVPVFLELLENGTGSELATIYGLAELGPAASAAVPELTRRLSSDRPAMRSAAAYALGRVGAAAGPAIGDLKRLRGDPSPSARRHAEIALRALAAEKPWWKVW